MTRTENAQEQIKDLQNQIHDIEKKLAKSEKVKKILMERVERSVDSAGDSYSLFERNILLEQHINKRTKELAEVNKQLLEEIKERKKIEDDLAKSRDEAIRATQVKTDFLANMSHEIRTPMNAILGVADLLWESSLTSEQRKYVRVCRDAGEQLLQLINDILDVSKVESGHLELENAPFDLDELMEKIGDVMAIRAHHKGLELTCHRAGDVPVQLAGDPARLHQILVNLIGNAIKFTEEGEISLDVTRNSSFSGREGDSEDTTVELLFAVKDTGIGIEQEKQDAVFDSFTQAESFITREYGGTGLGLTISKRLVELMGGRIRVESEPKIGSTFSFSVPFQVVAGLHTGQDTHMPEVNMAGMKTLIIDDNETNRMILRKTLSSWGAKVSESGDGWHGIAEIERARAIGKPYDLVLLDCRMPIMGGFEVAAQLKNKPGLLGITIMMLTSDHRPGDPEKARQLGINSYLVKPVKRSELRQSICTAMNHPGKPAAPAIPEAKALIAEDQRTLRILLVEDHENNRMFIKAYLKNTPYHLDIAENGEIACEKFVENRYDLVLMDIQMPVMDGYAATRWIRNWEQEQQLDPTPIIALTAHAFKEDMQKCLDAGCVACITKPVKKIKLIEIITTYSVPTNPPLSHAPGHFGNDEETNVTTAPGDGNKIIVHVDEAFKEFVPRFFEVTSEDIQTMGKALNDGDFETLQRLGHGMKGSGVSFGFDTMTDLGRSIEEAAKARNGDETRNHLANLIDYIEKVEVVIG